jgi:TDG/mug DNA glycosylase family protein
LLPDVIGFDLRVVFCGTAAGDASARASAYYAGPGNAFWPVLHEVGLKSTRLSPSDYARLLEYGIGLTDVCKRRSGSDRAIGREDFDVPTVVSLIEQFQPRILAFNGKRAAQLVLGHTVVYGPQTERLAATRLFVLPSTSGAARGFWDVRRWQQLAAAAA